MIHENKTFILNEPIKFTNHSPATEYRNCTFRRSPQFNGDCIMDMRELTKKRDDIKIIGCLFD